METVDLTHVREGQTVTFDEDEHWTVQALDERYVVLTRTPTAEDHDELAAEGHRTNGDLLFVALDRANGRAVVAGQRHADDQAARAEAGAILAELATADIELPTGGWVWLETRETYATRGA